MSQVPTAPPPFMRRLHDFLDPGDGMSSGERVFHALLTVLILLNVAVTVVGTVPEVAQDYGAAIRLFDLFSLLVFGLEYAARLSVTPLRPGFVGAGTGICATRSRRCR